MFISNLLTLFNEGIVHVILLMKHTFNEYNKIRVLLYKQIDYNKGCCLDKENMIKINY